MKISHYIRICILFCIAHTTYAQQAYTPQVANQVNSFFAYFGTHRVTDKWSIHSEIQVRRSDYVKQWQQLLLRAGLNYHIDSSMYTSAGYGFIETWPYGLQPIALQRPEHRLWEQFNLQHKFHRLDLQHRYRFEQRFLRNFTRQSSGEAVLSDGYEYQNRFRYRFMATLPLGSEKTGPGDFFLNAFNELFLNFGANTKANIFDQNRLGLQLGYQYSRNGNIQLGYMKQTIEKSDGIHFEANNTILFSLVYNTDWR